MIPMHVINRQGVDWRSSFGIDMGRGRAIASAAGGGAGQAVNVDVTFFAPMPNDQYTVLIQPRADVTWFIPDANKTKDGFRVTFTPRLAATTLGASSFDYFLVG